MTLDAPGRRRWRPDRAIAEGLRLPRIAVLGAGHVGPVIARVAVAAGYQVSIAASGDPEDIALITQVLVPGAEPRWAADAIADADIVVLAIPLHRFAAFDPALVAGKLVVDAMNYWPPDRRRPGAVRGPPVRQQRDRCSSGWPGRRSSRRSTTSATTSSKTNAGPSARRTAARSASQATTPMRWTLVPSHRPHRLRRRPAGQLRAGRLLQPAVRSSARRCAAPSSSAARTRRRPR